MDFFFQALVLPSFLVLLAQVLRGKLSKSAAWLIGATVTVLSLMFVAQSAFHIMRLLAWVLFAHLPVLLFAYGWWCRAQWKQSLAASALGVALLLVALDAFVLEPHDLEISQHRLQVQELSHSVRIAILADIQTDSVGPYERQVFQEVAKLRPDLLLLPGDFLQIYGPGRQQEEERLRQLLLEIQPKLGTWAVAGNVDPPELPQLFQGTQVHYAEQTSVHQVSNEIALVALSLRDSFDAGFQVPRVQAAFRIVMGHAPDFALGGADDDVASLYVAGHTHGGQVQLPFFGPPLTLSQVPRAWGAGDLVQLAEKRHLIVSRGIGMEREFAPRLRFLCRPELVVVDLQP